MINFHLTSDHLSGMAALTKFNMIFTFLLSLCLLVVN